MDLEPESSQQTSTQVAKSLPDATRLSRLLAQILDGVIIAFVCLPLMILFGIGANLDLEQIEQTGRLPMSYLLEITALIIFVYILVNGYHLWHFGQTQGKKLMSIAIVNHQDRVPAFASLVGYRYIPFQVLGVIPLISVLSFLDVLFIFRADRRCIHDFVAGTRVVDVSGIIKNTTAPSS